MRALDDLVRAGKVRYLGFSDTPAWKVAQAQTLALFRGWAPLIALQIEYSLLERTVEGELMPMARELGLGVTPWSPLKSGVLSGKYTRENAGDDEGRSRRAGDELPHRAQLRDHRRADPHRARAGVLTRLAWRWPGCRRGPASPPPSSARDASISSSRTWPPWTSRLTAEHIASLKAVSEPVLNFPAGMLKFVGMFTQGGLTVNGQTAPVWPAAPTGDGERY